MIKPTLFFFLISLLSMNVSAQLKRNELKTHPYIVFGELNLTYERILNPKLSIEGTISNSNYIIEPTWDNVIDCASINLRYYFKPRTYADSFFGSVYTKYTKERGDYKDVIASGLMLGYKYAFKFGLIVELYGGLGAIYIKRGERDNDEDVHFPGAIFHDIDINGSFNLGYRF